MCAVPLQTGFFDQLSAQLDAHFAGVVAVAAAVKPHMPSPPTHMSMGAPLNARKLEFNSALMAFYWAILTHCKAPLLRPDPSDNTTEDDDITALNRSGAFLFTYPWYLHPFACFTHWIDAYAGAVL